MVYDIEYMKNKLQKAKDKTRILSLVKIFTKDKNADIEHKKFLNEIINCLKEVK